MDLAFGLHFKDLYEREGLLRVDQAFLGFLGEADQALKERLAAARAEPAKLASKAESELLIALAPQVEDFIARLFRIEAEARALAQKHNELAPLYSVKRLFVQRRALHKVKPQDASPGQAKWLCNCMWEDWRTRYDSNVRPLPSRQPEAFPDDRTERAADQT